MPDRGSRLWAISDLHVEHEENRAVVEGLGPTGPSDWLLVAGDVANTFDGLAWCLDRLTERFAQVVWVPGNHELHCDSSDLPQARGVERYHALVELCRTRGVITPEDPYPVWEGRIGPMRILPMFLLYDHTFYRRPAGRPSGIEHEAWEDEAFLKSEPYPNCSAWCKARVDHTEVRLSELEPLPAVIVNHYPLRAEALKRLAGHPFAGCCGTARTERWHTRYRAAAVVHGHLHDPGRTLCDGVPFFEVSLGYPNERFRGSAASGYPIDVLPEELVGA